MSGKNIKFDGEEIKKSSFYIFIRKFDSEPAYGHNDKYIKTKLKHMEIKQAPIFKVKKNTKRKDIIYKDIKDIKCLSLIMIDSVVKLNKKYYRQVLLEECKYEIKKIKMENLINDSLEPSSSDDESDNESDNEYDNQ